MPSFTTGTVTALLEERAGLQRVEVDGRRAYVLTDLVGTVGVGDRVVVNTTAVELGLGTGGWDVVHWNLARDSWSRPGGGHVMKLRYTSLQADTGAAEEQHHDVPDHLDGAPVVACTLHSQVPCVAAAFAARAPGARLAYVMTDGAALPIALSDLVVTMRSAGLVCGTVTAGHAFGGDLEAVSLPAALALARHVLDADAIVVGMGPGVVGTGTALGTTAVEAAAALDAAAALGGRPVLAARASDADARERHRGRSHHTDTVLRLVRSDVLVPSTADTDVPDVARILATYGIRVTTMGRGPDADPAFFAESAAAGAAAAELLS